MSHDTITDDQGLSSFCDEIRGADIIAFDTEFVSEHHYRSELCLVQVATRDRIALIDPIAVPDLTPFWRMLAEGAHETVVHAGREELNFSLNAVERRPANLFDAQIAAGLVGYDYPAGYGSLLLRLLNVQSPKGEHAPTGVVAPFLRSKFNTPWMTFGTSSPSATPCTPDWRRRTD